MTTKWKQRYMDMAKMVGSWSKDPSRGIGAVIVGNHGQIVSVGYNGFPRGIEDSSELLNNRDAKYKRTVHAEANAIYNAIHSKANPVGCTIFVSGLPTCHDCAKALCQIQIKHVVMDTQPHSNDSWYESCTLALEYFDEVGITYEFI